MNLGIELLPARCEVLVVGAGPAGSAAAQLLARAGRDVVLIDQHPFPRDKVCGDGLIPDALHALDRLGVLAQVMGEARASTALACVAPRGGRVEVPGTLAVLPRKRLDEIVCNAAAAAGARMFAPLQFVAPLRDATSRVVGATLRHGDATREIGATWVVLATGAQPQATIAAGLCERRTPSGVAMRGYVKNAAMTARITRLEVVWHKRLAPGYGWIFPCGGDLFNIGVGVAQSERGSRPLNLHAAFAAFKLLHAPARELVEGGQWQAEAGEEMKGAPLRCSLEGAGFEAPGLLVVGEAAGSTYALTGEGIGKAMETAMQAAEAILASGDDAVVRSDYAARVRSLKPRFDLYEQAHRALTAHPWTLDLLVWSAKRSPRRVRRLTGVLEETYLPVDAVTTRGVLRRLFDWR
ncbi:MAG: geranylgeranyl reductase family protein [Caldimonas sp.]